MTSPLRALQARRVAQADRDMVRRALASPCGWPVDATLAASAVELGMKRAQDWGVGKVVLVSVDPPTRRTLWTLDLSSSPWGVSFVGSALETWKMTRGVGLACIDVLAPPRSTVLVAEPRAQQMWKSGEGKDHALDGDSFGLAFVAAHVSLLAEIATRPTVCGMAAVDRDGALRTVSALDDKLRVVIEGGLGISTVVVAQSQYEEACSILARLSLELGRSVAVVGASSVDAALEHFFQRPLVEELALRWQNDELRVRAIGALFDLALKGTPLVISWTAVAKAAEILLGMPGTPAQQSRAQVAHRIALRHAGDPNSRIPWDGEWLASLQGAARTRAIAHIVQSANDSCATDWRADAERAAAYLPPYGEESTEQLELLGALGRAHAAWASDEQAWALLSRAVQGWFGSGNPERASFALSSLLAHAVVVPAASQRERQCDEMFAQFDTTPGVDVVSRAYVGHARARQLEACGRLEEARRVLDATDSPDLPGHLRFARARTSTREARASGDLERAQSVLGEIPGADVQRALADLDLALHEGCDPEPSLALLRRDSTANRYVVRIRECAPEALPLAVQRRYPY